MYSNGELKVGSHVLYHDNKHDKLRDALVLVIFPEDNAPAPALTLVMIRPGERGIATKSMVPHRDDVEWRRRYLEGYWLMPAEVQES